MKVRTYYSGQMRCLRKFAADKYGDVGLMTDDDIKMRISGDGYVVLQDDDETLLLIKESSLESLEKCGDAVWLKR